jgi:hypothetical protein
MTSPTNSWLRRVGLVLLIASVVGGCAVYPSQSSYIGVGYGTYPQPYDGGQSGGWSPLGTGAFHAHWDAP